MLGFLCLFGGSRAGGVSASDVHLGTAPATEIHAFDQDWEFAYGIASLAEIRKEIEALRRFMEEETRAYYLQQFESGNYELITQQQPDGSFPLDVNHEDLAAWRYLPPLGVAKVILPREGFEKAYEARDRMSWLLNRESELEAFEDQSAKPR